jgi:hypothetical protein
MSAGPWEPWLSELERACDADDRASLLGILEGLWRFPFHEERAREHPRWDRLFAVLMRLMANAEPRVWDLAYHYARIAMGDEYGPAFGEHTPEQRSLLVARRTPELLTGLNPLVRAGAISLLRCIDDLVHVEGLADLGPQESCRDWIASFEDDAGRVLAARIAYLDGRTPEEDGGESARESLLAYLDHGDDRVRAYAARSLGQRYLGNAAELTPPLRDVVALLTAKEIERPGIAGPFFSNWYGDFAGAEFGKYAGVEVEEWFCTLLAQRKHPEPETLPCSNGIDFFAHEVFGGRAGYVRRLLDMGHEELAVQAATEFDEWIEDMEPLLLELADRADAEVCRQAAWHLASHYRRLSEAGERRGFVARRTLGDGDLFVNLAHSQGGGSYAYSAMLYPSGDEIFEDAEAVALLESVLPATLRNEMLPYGMPGDGDEPGLYVYGRSANARYRSGALVQFRGDVSAKRWERVRILWHGPPGAWRPEEAAEATG